VGDVTPIGTSSESAWAPVARRVLSWHGDLASLVRMATVSSGPKEKEAVEALLTYRTTCGPSAGLVEPATVVRFPVVGACRPGTDERAIDGAACVLSRYPAAPSRREVHHVPRLEYRPSDIGGNVLTVTPTGTTGRSTPRVRTWPLVQDPVVRIIR